MSGLLLTLTLLVAAPGEPIGWLVVPKVSGLLAKLPALGCKDQRLGEGCLGGGPRSQLDAAAVNDTIVVTLDASFFTLDERRMPEIIKLDQARYVDDPATVQASLLAPNAQAFFVFDGQRAIQSVDGRWQRAAQRVSLDKVKFVVGGMTFTNASPPLIDHIDALATYPPPRSGFVQAFGPPVASEIPAWVPNGVLAVACISVQPSAVFNQANMAFAAVDSMGQALFFTQLRALESQYGRHFADDALGISPQLWTFYRKGIDRVGVLDVADVELVERFLDNYADALPALLPGATVERKKVAGRDAVSITLPSKKTFAIAYDKQAVVVAERFKALQNHFAAKGKGKASVSPTSAIAYGLFRDNSTLAWTMVLTDAGLRFAGGPKK